MFNKLYGRGQQLNFNNEPVFVIVFVVYLFICLFVLALFTERPMFSRCSGDADMYVFYLFYFFAMFISFNSFKERE